MTLANRVRELTLTTGVGDITLGGALAAHISFADAFTVGDMVTYVIEDGDNYEIGSGTLTATDTLARTLVGETLVDGVYDKAAPAAISLSGGALVFCAVTSEFLLNPNMQADTISEVTLGAGVLVDGVLLKGGAITSAGDVNVVGANRITGGASVFDAIVVQDTMAGTIPVHWQKQATSYVLQAGGVGNLATFDLANLSAEFLGSASFAGNVILSEDCYGSSSSDGVLYGGGTSNILGANILMRAEGHADANDMYFRSGTTPWLIWDASASTATFASDIDVTGELTVTSTSRINADAHFNGANTNVNGLSNFAGEITRDTGAAGQAGLTIKSTTYNGATAFTHTIDFEDTTGVDGQIFFRHDTSNNDYMGFRVGGNGSSNEVLQLRDDLFSAFAGDVSIAQSSQNNVGLQIGLNNSGIIQLSSNADYSIRAGTWWPGLRFYAPDIVSTIVNGVVSTTLTDTELTVNVPASFSGQVFAKSSDAGAVTAVVDADDLVIERNGNVGMSILGPDASAQNIYFGSPSNSVGSFVRWRSTINEMTMATNHPGASLVLETGVAVPALTLDGNQKATFTGDATFAGDLFATSRLAVGASTIPVWASGWDSIDFGGGASLMSSSSSISFLQGVNWYYNGPTYKRKQTGGASRLVMNPTAITFNIAASDAADTDIAWLTALAIDSSLNVDMYGDLDVAGDVSTSGSDIEIHSTSTGNNGLLRFYDNIGTERGQIYAGSADMRIFAPQSLAINAPTVDFLSNALTGVDQIIRSSTTDLMVIAGGGTSGTGSRIALYSEGHLTRPGRFELYDSGDLALNFDPGQGQFGFYDNALDRVGNITMSGTDVARSVDNSSWSISGGTLGSGAVLTLTGGAHATQPSEVIFKDATTRILSYASNVWDAQGNAFKAGTITTDDLLALDTEIAEPSSPSTGAVIYLDSADSDLKVKFSNGTVATLASN